MSARGRPVNLGFCLSVGYPAFDTQLNCIENPILRIDVGSEHPIVERPETPNKLRAFENKRDEMSHQRVAVDRNPADSFDQSLEFID